MSLRPSIKLALGLAYGSMAQIHSWPVFNDEVVQHVGATVDRVLEAAGSSM